MKRQTNYRYLLKLKYSVEKKILKKKILINCFRLSNVIGKPRKISKGF